MNSLVDQLTGLPAGWVYLVVALLVFVEDADGLVWGVAVVLVGFVAGLSYQRVADRFGEAAALTLAVIAVAALVVWRLRNDRDGGDESERT